MDNATAREIGDAVAVCRAVLANDADGTMQMLHSYNEEGLRNLAVAIAHISVMFATLVGGGIPCEPDTLFDHIIAGVNGLPQ